MCPKLSAFRFLDLKSLKRGGGASAAADGELGGEEA